MNTELSVTQAARMCGIAERTCRKWLAEGKLEGRKVRKGSRDVWRVSAASCRSQQVAEQAAAHNTALGPQDWMLLLRAQSEQIGRLTDEVAALRGDLQRLLPAHEEAEPMDEKEARGWWQRLWHKRTQR